MNIQEIYYIHEASSTVISLTDLRKIKDNTKIIIKIPYFDETFKEYFSEEFTYKRIHILTGRDWTICPVTRESLTKAEIEEIRNCLYENNRGLYERLGDKLSGAENNLLTINNYETIKGLEKDNFGLKQNKSVGGYSL